MSTAAALKRATTSVSNSDDLAREFAASLNGATAASDLEAISLEGLRMAFAAVVKMYAAKIEASGQEALAPVEADALTTTEAVIGACGLIRSADLNLFDVAMWFGRYRPEHADERRGMGR